MKKTILIGHILAMTSSCLLSSISAFAEGNSRGLYLSVFAGAGRSNGDEMRQTGQAYAYEPKYNHGEEYLLPVDVSGNIKNDNFGMGGLGIGYEWASVGAIKPALEFELLYFNGNQNANLKNRQNEVGISRENGELLPDETIFPGNHSFSNRYKMGSFGMMLNGLVGFDTGTIFTPYFGAGLGMAKIKMRDSKSAQTCKFYGEVGSCSIEMSDNQVVNHFNSDDSGSDYVFATQAKLGVRAELSKNISMFGEYRYVRLNAANFRFGRTIYDDHLDTSAWKVKTDATDMHFGVLGLQYIF
jgi:opacity protein-like surface antigen